MDPIDSQPTSLNGSLDAAAQALSAFTDGPARAAADALGTAFDRAGGRIAGALTNAARTGELSVRAMVASILTDLARVSVQQAVTGPLQSVISGALSGISFGGARAAGGPVTSGHAYLVGERGPELFTPATTGQISSPSGPSITVNVAMGSANANDLRRSAGQIATALARVVASGSQRA